MVVLHLISGGEVGGSKNHLVSLALNMKKTKNIIICFMKGKLYDEALEMGLDIRLVEQDGRFDLSIVSKIYEICRNEKVDIVNCHGGRANFIGYFLKKKYGVKYVTTIHSDYRDDYKGNFYKTLIFSNINRFVLKSFDYYITVSDSFKDMLVQRGFKKEKIFVVYNGIDFKRQVPSFDRREIIDKYSIPESGHYITMVARFHPVKGHKVFLEACSKVLRSFNDVVFILAGDGSLKEEMQEYARALNIQSKVFFAGFRKPDEFLYISDFTVLTSYSESFPLSILESAFFKKTVISTDVGGISKLIDDGINGYLIKPGDSESLAEKMIEMLKDPERTHEYGLKLHEKAKNNFSIQNLADKYEEIYRTVANGGIR